MNQAPSFSGSATPTSPARPKLDRLSFRQLFSPLRIGSQELPNRFVMGSMHTGLEEDPAGLSALAAFYGARAKGGVGLIITGGFAPNKSGALMAGSAVLETPAQSQAHRCIPNTVHQSNTRILLQILHAGRYALHPDCVAPSPLKAPVSHFTPRAMSSAEIEATIAAYGNCASLARQAGYDGVEIMGSEGYLINQFLAPRTNQRIDDWGGSATKRRRLACEIVRAVRTALDSDALLAFRISVLDLVEQGSAWNEVVELAHAVQEAGANLIDCGIGWHESRVPTISGLVPPAAFAKTMQRLRQAITLPLIATNRIHTPELAESLLVAGVADLISMARPLLADPLLIAKTAAHQPEQINLCISCNQTCLDQIFAGNPVGCLVNPDAGHEIDPSPRPCARPGYFAVVGAGPAGLACASALAQRGHSVTLFDAQPRIGGQFNLAQRIPGKEIFADTIRHYGGILQSCGVKLQLGRIVQAAQLLSYDHVVLATGVRPRRPVPFIEQDSRLMDYEELLSGQRQAGARVAIVGAGGIGFDVAEFLVHQPAPPAEQVSVFESLWGVDTSGHHPGGLCLPANPTPERQVWLFQRKSGALGKRLGKTTGWARRLFLQKHGVRFVTGVSYQGLEQRGLAYTHQGKLQHLSVDSVVLCAGQEERRELAADLSVAGVAYTVIGGADQAAELDAQRAIAAGTKLGRAL